MGLALFFAGAAFASTDNPYLVGWIGMVGTVLTLHFGLFHLLSCAWRLVGVNARPLMDDPLTSESVTEFWGRRWNTAFRDLTHRFLFRPLMPSLGARGAIFGGFVFSGIVHDVVISLPARGGYGGPTLFFASQALAMLFERSSLGRRFGLGRGIAGRIFTAAVLLIPVYFLFYPPFVERIMVPFMRALGAA
jgi:D-alanyl-lipoteichoic acid acyltransferase DltB (MBOAT superfamily)